MPPGVLNIVTLASREGAAAVGEEFASNDPAVRRINFTGSTAQASRSPRPPAGI